MYLLRTSDTGVSAWVDELQQVCSPLGPQKPLSLIESTLEEDERALGEERQTPTSKFILTFVPSVDVPAQS